MRATVIRVVLLSFGLILVDSARPDQSELGLTVLDEHGKLTGARLRLYDGQGKAQPVSAHESLIVAHPRFPELGAIMRGQCRIQLPAGRSVLRIDRGTEYRQLDIEVDSTVSPKQERTVRLQRWIDMAVRGWWSGDMHVHRAPADMEVLMMASDLHFAPAITRWNERSNLDSWPAQKIYTSETRAYSIDNCEDERGWGAALFFGVKNPIKLYHARMDRDYPPPNATWEEARQRNAFIDLEKATWWSAPVIAAIIPPDSIGVAVNHFMEEGLMDSEAWGRPRDKSAYPGQLGFAHYIFDLYYKYLNSGRRLPASAGSANGVLRSPLGYNRSYVFLEGQFSFDRWLEGQRAGRNFVTNGPMLFLMVDGERPGAVLRDRPSVLVKFEALSSTGLEKVELVVDGSAVKEFLPQQDRSRIAASMRVAVRRGGWLAARCFEKNRATVRFAHTSPIYIGRNPARSADALQYMRDWIDAEMGRIRELKSVTDAQREELLQLCKRAQTAYELRH